MDIDTHRLDQVAGSITSELKPDEIAPAIEPKANSNLIRSMVEVTMFLVAVVGALALGLGITEYLSDRPYVFAYLVAFAGFRIADALVKPAYDPLADRYRPRYQPLGQLPLLLFFAAVPFERTYIYGGEGPGWLAALGLPVELVGLWMVLAARLQLGRFGTPHLTVQEGQRVIRTGLYRHIRHPVYAGTMLVLLAWPMEYGAPMVAITLLVVGALVLHSRIEVEEAMMLKRFGDEYASYAKETNRLIPGIY